ncbi:MAG: nicotinamide-nucleotide amidohydrolase family protein [Pseudomonadota bacterium]
MASIATLATELGATLKARGFVLALAESCTGGMAAQAITSVAGSSAWFDRGFVTYSNQAKIDMLGVNNQTLIQFGAVSEQTAAEMAQGALKFSLAQISASITGIAGPDGGTADKPVGTVCFGFALINSVKTSTQHFVGKRESVRQQASIYAISQLIELIRIP